MSRNDWLWRNTNEATESRERIEQEARTARLGKALAEVTNTDAVAAVLREHWLTGVECDHAARTDVATCYCSTWRSAPQPTHGEAVEAWVQHVLELLRDARSTPSVATSGEDADG